MTFSRFCHSRGVEMGIPQRWLPSPHSARGGGWQLTGPFLVLHPSRRAGEDGGQGTTLTHDNLSHVLSRKSLNFNVPTNHSTPIVATDSPPIPSLLPLTRWSRLPASYGGSGCGIDGRKLSLIISYLCKSLPGTCGCPSGDSDRRLTDPRFSLQPRRPNKSPWTSESRKQIENPESIFASI
jgi:hypothetical protein